MIRCYLGYPSNYRNFDRCLLVERMDGKIVSTLVMIILAYGLSLSGLYSQHMPIWDMRTSNNYIGSDRLSLVECHFIDLDFKKENLNCNNCINKCENNKEE